MKLALNHHPELTMSEITKNLFNNELLSDIGFCVDGKMLFAHTLELMKRSLVFEKVFESYFDQLNIITINNFSYKSFYEFIRFIYTDECDVDQYTCFELFTLAAKYKIVKLENQLLEFLLQNETVSLSTRLSLFEYCIAENYQLPYNLIKSDIAQNLNDVMKLDKFKKVSQNTIAEILKFDCIDKNVNEVQLFNELVNWIHTFCLSNEIELTRRRETFDTLLRLIRYTTMRMDEFRAIMHKYSDLFAANDICKFLNDPEQISTPRNLCVQKYEKKYLRCTQIISETKFSVTKEVLFIGFRYGCGGNQETILSRKNLETYKTESMKLGKKLKDGSIYKTIYLGETLVLKPNMQYAVQVSYDSAGCNCWSLIYRVNEILINDPSKAVKLLDPGTTMFEILFKQPMDIMKPPELSTTKIHVKVHTTDETKDPIKTTEVPIEQKIEKFKISLDESEPISENVELLIEKSSESLIELELIEDVQNESIITQTNSKPDSESSLVQIHDLPPIQDNFKTETSEEESVTKDKSSDNLTQNNSISSIKNTNTEELNANNTNPKEAIANGTETSEKEFVTKDKSSDNLTQNNSISLIKKTNTEELKANTSSKDAIANGTSSGTKIKLPLTVEIHIIPPDEKLDSKTEISKKSTESLLTKAVSAPQSADKGSENKE